MTLQTKSQMLSKLTMLLMAMLTTASAHAINQGGGSSTGGGHVRVCMTPAAAARVKSVLTKNSQVPQIATDPFSNLKTQEIISVELVDLLEHPSLRAPVMTLLKEIKAEMGRKTLRDPKNRAIENDPRPVQVMKLGLELLNDRFKKTGLSCFADPQLDILDSTVNVESNFEWTPSKSGLRLTNDFDPKIENASNCVFAQAVRQTVFSDHFATLDYDAKLLARMKDEDLIALGLHEGMYNAVLVSPDAKKVQNPSVTTRQLTMLSLGVIAKPMSYEESLAAVLESLGYGPFGDMMRPSNRMSRAELIEANRQSDGLPPSPGWPKLVYNEEEVAKLEADKAATEKAAAASALATKASAEKSTDTAKALPAKP